MTLRMEATRTSHFGATPQQVRGQQDGPDLMLPSGVRIRRQRIGGVRVTQAQVLQAIRGIQLLPLQHQQLIARLGLAIELVPLRFLEQVAGATEPVVGSTLIDGPVGRGRPTSIRIASYMEDLGRKDTTVHEAVQHEIGHALAVSSAQDRSEQTARRYAATY